jgi:alkylation response protein AidB-like acyl-CoA dehydrogenase
MRFALDEDQDLIVSTVRRFVEQKLRVWAGDADRAGKAPTELSRVAGELGFYLDAVPADADGLLDEDYSHVIRALRGIELGRGCAAMAALLETNVEPSLAVARWGSEAAKSALFGAVTDDRLAVFTYDFYGALGIDAKGDAAVLSGTLGPLPALASASHALVAAHLGAVGEERGEPLLLLVPLAEDMVEAQTPSCWRAAEWGKASFDGFELAPEWILARGTDADKAIADVLAWARSSLAARAIGVAQVAMENAKQYGEERIQFDRPIGTFESLARMRDASETATAAGRLLVLEAAWQIDNSHPAAHDTASRARDFAVSTLATTSIDAVQIYGGYGFVNDYPVEKLMRDARAFEVLYGLESFSRVVRLAETA